MVFRMTSTKYITVINADDFEEIKQDIQSFRFEMLNQWKIREEAQNEMAENVKNILQSVSDSVQLNHKVNSVENDDHS